eukprot:SAG11_NODE_3825_length_2205_cov_16.866572_1_plen_98_part_10
MCRTAARKSALFSDALAPASLTSAAEGRVSLDGFVAAMKEAKRLLAAEAAVQAEQQREAEAEAETAAFIAAEVAAAEAEAAAAAEAEAAAAAEAEAAE